MNNLKKFSSIFFLTLLSFSCTAKENQNPKKEGVMNSYISVSMENGLKMFSESENAVLLDVMYDESTNTTQVTFPAQFFLQMKRLHKKMLKKFFRPKLQKFLSTAEAVGEAKKPHKNWHPTVMKIS